MRLSYLLKTCADHVRQTWLSNVLSVFTIMFLLVLIGLVGMAWLNVHQLLRSLSSQVQIQAYISNGLDEEQIAQLRQRLLRVSGVERIEYVSKTAAAESFQKEFGRESFDVLQENPLPASFIILAQEGYRSEAGLKGLSARIQAEKGIDEAVSHFKMANLLNRYQVMAARVNLLLFVFVAAGSLLLVANNIRLVISSQQHRIETMRLVGATAGFIRLPLLVEGLGQGALGGSLALLALHGAMAMVNDLLGGFPLQGLQYSYLLLVLGSLLGLLGSWIGVKKYLR